MSILSMSNEKVVVLDSNGGISYNSCLIYEVEFLDPPSPLFRSYPQSGTPEKPLGIRVEGINSHSS